MEGYSVAFFIASHAAATEPSAPIQTPHDAIEGNLIEKKKQPTEDMEVTFTTSHPRLSGDYV